MTSVQSARFNLSPETGVAHSSCGRLETCCETDGVEVDLCDVSLYLEVERGWRLNAGYGVVGVNSIRVEEWNLQL